MPRRPHSELAPLLSAAILTLAACRTEPSAAELTVAGSVEGAATLPAEAIWCAGRGVLQLFAVRGDSGVGIAVLADSLASGLYPVVVAPTEGWWPEEEPERPHSAPTDSATPASPGIDSAGADTAGSAGAPPPAGADASGVATVALRWPATSAIGAYQGDSGEVRLEVAGARVVATVGARLRSVSNDSLVRLTARLAAVAASGGAACVGEAAADSAGTADRSTGVN
jgi:hypothetical protein